MTTTQKRQKRDQRKHPRVPVGVTMDIVTQGPGAGARCRGTIADLSVGGMTFRSDAVLEEGMCLHLTLGAPLRIRGEVAHVRPGTGGLNHYGIRFHKIAFETPVVSR